MSALDLVTYGGSTSTTGFDDLTTGPELVSALEGADGLVVLDPMSFPWEAFDDAPHCPVVVDLSTCDDHDVIALMPVLAMLTPSDLLLGEQRRVQSVCAAIELPMIWGTKADIERHLVAKASSKTIDLQVRAIIDPLASDEAVTTVVLSGDEVRSWRRGFLALVDEVRDRHSELANTELAGIWGVHHRPGEQLERAVLAFRTATPAVLEQ